jgi:NADPH:quinone reductase-like Zn-dependent oxidoreductase
MRTIHEMGWILVSLLWLQIKNKATESKIQRNVQSTRVHKKGSEIRNSSYIRIQQHPFNGGSGAFAEQALANIKNIAYKPKKLSHVESAALPPVGGRLQKILDYHQVKRVLIHGGAGGRGSISIQLDEGT